MRAMILIPLRSPRWLEREYTRSVEDKTRRGRAHLAPPLGNHDDVGHDFDYDYDLAPPLGDHDDVGNHGDHGEVMIIMLMMTMTVKTMIKYIYKYINICPRNSFIII